MTQIKLRYIQNKEISFEFSFIIKLLNWVVMDLKLNYRKMISSQIQVLESWLSERF